MPDSSSTGPEVHLETARGSARVDAVERLLRSRSTSRVDRLADLAARLLGAPSAQVSLLSDVQVVAGSAGLPDGTSGTSGPVADSLCTVTAGAGVPVAVADAVRDDRVRTLPPVTTGAVGSYLGAPLVDVGGHVVGALCVFGSEPRDWTPAEVVLLEQVAASAVAEMELTALTEEHSRALREEAERTAAVLESMSVGYLALDLDWRVTYLNAEGRRFLGAVGPDVVGRDFWDLFPSARGTIFETEYRRAVADREVVSFDAYYPEPLNAWFEVRATPETDGLSLYFLDVTSRYRAQEARDLAAHRVAELGRVALELAGTQDISSLVTAVAERGITALGCDGGALAVVDGHDPDVVLSYVTASYGAQAQAEYARLPVSGALPVCEVVRTGRAVFVNGRAEAVAYSPEMAHVVEATGSQSFASLPLRVGDRTIGVLTAGWVEVQDFTADRIGLLEAFAAQVAQALHRLQALGAERDAAGRVARMSEGLQRSLLTELPEPDHVQIAARYVPAAAHAQVGGDWYDAFFGPDGATYLVIGDVAGHDREAAVAMAQFRNVLRGVAHALGASPAVVLGALDHAVEDLAVGALATAVLARVEQTPSLQGTGFRTLRWSSAGHLAPLVLHGGTAEFLSSPPELLLGLQAGGERTDHTVELAPDTTLLLFTDGLVERRTEHLQRGLDRLRAVAADLVHLDLETFCDRLVAALATGAEDDVAVLAVRTHPEDRPRPPEAGPEVLPADLVEGTVR